VSSMPTKLGDLCSVITKGTTPTSIGFDFSDSGVRFLRVQNIFDGKVNYDDDTLFIGEDVHDALKRSQIAPGDVLISIAGTIGRTGIVPDHAPELNCNQAVAILRTNEKVYQPFLRHWLESAEAQRQMRGATVTGTIQNLSLSQIGELRIPLPPLPEQRRIAAILDKADALRTKRREALAQLDRLAQSIFVEMFGDPTRPESTGACPTSKVQLGNFVKIQTGKLDANAAVEGGAYPFFTCAVKSLDIDIAAFDCKAVLVAGNGDLNVKYYEGKFNAYQRTYVIQSTDEHRLLPKFLYQFLDLYVAELRKQAIGGVIKYIKLPYLTDAPLNIPAIEFQKEFVARFDAIAAERKKLAEALALSERLFLSVQLRAFRGEL
jgi:type I restriction enzyme S subunit